MKKSREMDLAEKGNEENNSARLNLLFFLGGLVGGGAERVASQLIHYWVDKLGHRVTLVTRLGTGHDRYPVSKNVRRIVIGDGGESSNKAVALSRNIPVVLKLRRELKGENYDAALSFLTKANIHLLLASIGLLVPVVISERNDTTREQHPFPWPLLRKWLYRCADFVTANSDVALKGMKSYVPGAKLRIIPNPVCIPDTPANPHESKRLLLLGRLTPEKRHALFLEAFQGLGESQKAGWKVDVVGEGPLMEQIENEINRNGLHSTVLLRGWQADPESYLQRAALFVLPSAYEGTPNALLEAMAFGLPVIISDSLPGAKAVVEEGVSGYHFRSGDPQDLQNKLTLLMSDPVLRRTMGENAAKAVSGFALETISEMWLQLVR